MTNKESQDQIAFYAVEKRIAEAIKDNNAHKAAAIAYQYHADHDISGLERVVIESGNGSVAFEFSLIPGANISKLQQVVIDHGDGFDALMFARHHNDVADIPALQRVVEKSARNMMYGDQFIRDVRGADKEAFIQSVIERGTGRQATQTAEMFATNIEGLQTVLMDSTRTLATDIANFARRIKGADIAYLQDAARKHSIDAMYYFSDVPGADLRSIHEALIRSERHWSGRSHSLHRKVNNMLKGFIDRHGDKLSIDDSDTVMVTRMAGSQSNQQAAAHLVE